jgi:GTPase SAR1 family protein
VQAKVLRPSIVMIGGPNAGKSHFTFQLFGRLFEHSYDLKLRAMPNLGLFKDGLHQLNSGLQAEHTSLHKYDNADFSLADSTGRPVDLLWPDYGGEQISQILQQRGVDDAWKQRIETADGFLLFIRLHDVVDYKNIVEHPLAADLERRSHSEEHTEPDLSSQAGIVEMLQILLWSTRKRGRPRLLSPKLGVLLTCWDELDNIEKEPSNVLAERAPLLEQFIRGTWAAGSCFIYGLSSLERSLDPNKVDDEFVIKGPESFGYVVRPDGSRTHDLTAPISGMLTLLDEDRI